MNNDEKILQMLEQMNNRFDQVDSRFDKLEFDVKEMKTDIKQLKTDSKQMQSDISELKTDVKYIKINQDEHHKILNVLIYNSEVRKAEVDNLNIGIAKISGIVSSIEGKIDILSSDLNTVEHITAKNYTDIIRLKTK